MRLWGLARRPLNLPDRGALAALEPALEPDLVAQASVREPVQAVPMELPVLELTHLLAAQ